MNTHGRLFLGPDGRMYAVWHFYRSGDCRLVVADSSDMGRTFSALRTITTCSDSVWLDPWMASVASVGNSLYVGWSQSEPASSRSSLMAASSVDGGETFQVREVLASNSSDFFFPSLAVLGSRLFLGWTDNTSGTGFHAYLSYSDDGGTSFSTPRRVNPDYTNGSGQQEFVSLYAAPNGVLYVVWDDELQGPFENVFVLTTTDGTTLSARVRISDVEGQVGHVQALPDGRMVAAWRELNGVEDVAYAVSSNGGAAWGPSTVFTFAGRCGSDVTHFGMALSSGGELYVALAARQYDDDHTGYVDLFVGMVESPFAAQQPPICAKVNPGDAHTTGGDYRLYGQAPSIVLDTSENAYVLYSMRIPEPADALYLAVVSFEPVNVDSMPSQLVWGVATAIAVCAILGAIAVSAARRGRRRPR